MTVATGWLQVGPHICVFKTHVDIFDKWDDAIVQQLQELADKHGAPPRPRRPEPWLGVRV